MAHVTGGSVTSVCADLAEIWRKSATLSIPSEESVSEYHVILVIPALFNAALAPKLVSVLLEDIGFATCFLVQVLTKSVEYGTINRIDQRGLSLGQKHL